MSETEKPLFGAPTVLLKPFQQIMFDSEWIMKGTAPSDFRFFVHGNKMGNGMQKTEHDCSRFLMDHGNLLCLPHPMEFSLFGFSFDFHGLDEKEVGPMFRDALFSFTYVGAKLLLSVPASQIPDRKCGWKDWISETKPATKKPSLKGQKRLAEHMHRELTNEELEKLAYSGYLRSKKNSLPKELYRFLVGQSALRIRATEEFAVLVNWKPGHGWKAPCDVKITAMMVGLLWHPM
jgi:hypothetical protein